MERDRGGPRRPLAVIGWVALVPALVLLGMRLAPSQSWTPAAQLVGLLPLTALPAMAALLVLGAARRRVGTVVAAGAVVGLLTLLLPRAVDTRADSGAPGEHLRVGAVNAYFGRADASALAATIEEQALDLVCVAEATPRLEADLRAAGLTAYLPGLVSAAEGGTSGTVLYSRLPVTALPEVAGTRFRMPRAVVVAPPGVAVTVTCAHPLPPRAGGLDGWDTELRRIRDTVAATTGPQVVLGDVNATWDHRLLRDIAAAGDLRDVANTAGEGLRPTWPMRDGPIPMPFVAIDRILTDLDVVDYGLVDVEGSEHRMVVATLGVTPGRG